MLKSTNEYPATSKGFTITIGNDSIAHFVMLAVGKEKKKLYFLIMEYLEMKE